MKSVITRKCKACKNPITIHRNNVQGVVYFKQLYYHSECFCDLAHKRINSKHGKPQEWQDALDKLPELEKYTKEILTARVPRREATDDLNDYLLSKYNTTTMPDRFWVTVADLNNGIYKHRRCKKVSTQLLLESWKWAQKHLDEIDSYNKLNHRGPQDDRQRISYDLAIIINKIPQYLAYKTKRDAEELDRKHSVQDNIKIDYDKIKASTSGDVGLDDISDLLDDLI